MKNLLFTVAIVLTTTSLFAQKGLELTLGFTPGLSFMLNDEDFAAGDNLNYQATFGFHTGLTVGYNFNDKIGIATGIGYASLGQNYTTAYDNRAKADQSLSNINRTQIRVPILFRAGGDNTAGSTAFFRFGPHFDFLSTAILTDKGSKNNPRTSNNTTNFRNQTKPFSGGETYDVYSSMVVGMTLEVGGRIRINDQMGILALFHLETSLTNPEGADAKYFFENTGSILNNTLERSQSFSIMAGLTVGIQYVFDFSK